MLRGLIVLLLACSLCACPDEHENESAAQLQPQTSIPDDHPLLKYADLRLGMSNFDISQAYNAPDGKGKGFSRTVEDFGEVRNHLITFEQDNRELRKLVLRVYQDKLAIIVDRRDGLSEDQTSEWLAEIRKRYGDPVQETLMGAQWVWGEQGDVSLTFTQDNASPTNMSANVVLVHQPTYEASKRYLKQRATEK